MKTKTLLPILAIILLTSLLAIILLTSLILTRCSNDSEPNFGEHGAKVYEPTLSEMSDKAIVIEIDDLFNRHVKNYDRILVLQNELILRQLEALNGDNKLTITDAGYWIKGTLKITVDDSPDKRPIQPHHKKQGVK